MILPVDCQGKLKWRSRWTGCWHGCLRFWFVCFFIYFFYSVFLLAWYKHLALSPSWVVHRAYMLLLGLPYKILHSHPTSFFCATLSTKLPVQTEGYDIVLLFRTLDLIRTLLEAFFPNNFVYICFEILCLIYTVNTCKCILHISILTLLSLCHEQVFLEALYQYGLLLNCYIMDDVKGVWRNRKTNYSSKKK